MPNQPLDPFRARTTATVGGRRVTYWRISALEEQGLGAISRLPFSIKILLESVLRQLDGYQITEEDVRALAAWRPGQVPDREVPFKPARVVLQDFTGVPAVVDLAAMRSMVQRLGGDPERINPLVPVDLVIDHSVQVDAFAAPTALEQNIALEFERNQERYRFLKWAQQAFRNFRVVPPDTGIIHQVNLEYLATVVTTRDHDGEWQAFPDSVVGTDSHTTMINGMGVLGWGVGGIEAEANMLGQPLYFLIPDVVGVRLVGRLGPGATATDLALTVTQRLRQHGVVGKFVEFFGPGLDSLSLADRATVANMAPEYGATVGFFPADHETLAYLAMTGRSDEHRALVEWYLKAQGLFREPGQPDPEFSEVLEIDLGAIEPTLAGPKRPQDRVSLGQMQSAFRRALTAPVEARGFGLAPEALGRTAPVGDTGQRIGHGAVVIAAITSCTNTSNPFVMMAAGILAQKAVARGLRTPPWVKTSLAPGSRVVTAYLERAGLLDPLARLGFAVVGYGCTTCIGNSGPLPEAVAEAITAGDLTVAAVLSGNRNFEGRIHALVKANYLASPPLVVAYALAGTVDIDLERDPLGTGSDGQPVYLRDVWPSSAEVEAAMAEAIQGDLFRQQYQAVWTANPYWNQLEAPKGQLYAFDPQSTYIQEPPFFQDWSPEPRPIAPIRGARALAVLGDSVTTDHISPAGNIAVRSPAGQYLLAHGVEPSAFNSYGARRGNHEVMMRGTFANIRIRNRMVPDVEGGFTRHLPDGEVLPIYEAAMRYQAEGVPLIVLAGKEYGTGSSRDWAAKGSRLLGVRAVLAESFERIHRANLVGMGVLPLEFKDGASVDRLGLTGEEEFDIPIAEGVTPRAALTVWARRPNGETVPIPVTVRLDTPVEVDYYRHGGILQTVLAQLVHGRR
ncbi:MAG: aconitate hydratase AcnA [Firmicutes bacterium]|nr:aconitate hydratase AcnA [Alicyclobacillaceae bacterium]MCL6498265.1 aconitate hydratase AcnA [Bacillota bacterium]